MQTGATRLPGSLCALYVSAFGRDISLRSPLLVRSAKEIELFGCFARKVGLPFGSFVWGIISASFELIHSQNVVFRRRVDSRFFVWDIGSETLRSFSWFKIFWLIQFNSKPQREGRDFGISSETSGLSFSGVWVNAYCSSRGGKLSLGSLGTLRVQVHWLTHTSWVQAATQVHEWSQHYTPFCFLIFGYLLIVFSIFDIGACPPNLRNQIILTHALCVSRSSHACSWIISS